MAAIFRNIRANTAEHFPGVFVFFFGIQILLKLLLVCITNCTEIITSTFLFEYLEL